ncbi:MAG: hypothetical protein AAF697_01785 [Pseudomonadota bacterium]
MNLPATSISTSAKSRGRTRTFALAAALCLALTLPASAHAQVRMPGDEPDVEDIARTPLDVLNIDPEDIPQVLVEATLNPYATEGLDSCNAIVVQVARIDTVLGYDFDIAIDEEGRRISRGRVAQSVVGSFIPFRGIVREVSGARKRQSEVNEAITAGMVRRGFLKGLGMERGCEYPARPRERPLEMEQ